MCALTRCQEQGYRVALSTPDSDFSEIEDSARHRKRFAWSLPSGIGQLGMIEFHSRAIIGAWRAGFALDLHTITSTYVGDDEFGRPRFDTQRSAVGDLLYQLKYHGDKTAVAKIAEAADAADALVKQWKPAVDVIVPVPPSTVRSIPTVLLIAESISKRVGIPLVDCVRRTREVQQLKDVTDLDERLNLLRDLHVVDRLAIEGKRVLLFDDLYRSGATLNAITKTLYESGNAKDVLALTITRTRSNR